MNRILDKKLQDKKNNKIKTRFTSQNRVQIGISGHMVGGSTRVTLVAHEKKGYATGRSQNGKHDGKMG